MIDEPPVDVDYVLFGPAHCAITLQVNNMGVGDGGGPEDLNWVELSPKQARALAIKLLQAADAREEHALSINDGLAEEKRLRAAHARPKQEPTIDVFRVVVEQHELLAQVFGMCRRLIRGPAFDSGEDVDAVYATLEQQAQQLAAKSAQGAAEFLSASETDEDLP